MTRLQKAERFGRDTGSMITALVITMGAIFLWLAIQAASAIVAIALIGLFIYAFGGLFMDTAGSALSRFIRELVRIPDTRNRVHAMEEYHEIDYTVIPEKRLYVRKGETCELTIRRIAEPA